MNTLRGQSRTARALAARLPAPEARRILRRGARIAAGLNGGRADDDILAFVCGALAQEGRLVQEIMEELASGLTSSGRRGPGSRARRRRGASA